MSSNIAFIISMAALVFIIVVVVLGARQGSLNIKSKAVGDVSVRHLTASHAKGD